MGMYPLQGRSEISSKLVLNVRFSLGHFQVGSYRYRSLIEGLYTL